MWGLKSSEWGSGQGEVLLLVGLGFADGGKDGHECIGDFGEVFGDFVGGLCWEVVVDGGVWVVGVAKVEVVGLDDLVAQSK